MRSIEMDVYEVKNEIIVSHFSINKVKLTHFLNAIGKFAFLDIQTPFVILLDRVAKKIIESENFMKIVKDFQNQGIAIVKYSDLRNLKSLDDFMKFSKKSVLFSAWVDNMETNFPTSFSISPFYYRR